MKQNLVLSGMMGAGKSDVGKILAQMLGLPFFDLDDLVEAAEGKTVAELFRSGEPVFREAELRAVERWSAGDAPRGPSVLALGGGTLTHPGLLRSLQRSGVVVHLSAGTTTLLQRLGAAGISRRPLLADAADPRAVLDELQRKRASSFAQADLVLKTDNLDLRDTAVALLHALYCCRSGLWYESPRSLADYLGDGEIAGAAVRLGRGTRVFERTRHAALLIDSDLPSLHREAVVETAKGCSELPLLVMHRPGGECSKSLESVELGWKEMQKGRVDRDTPLWVVGGGTITDLGGFLAATFKRSVPLSLQPTTLLGQLDAALGGKNGINLGGAKNIVGTIRLPSAVHLDPIFLLTLSDVDLRGGLSEAVKSAMIDDPSMLDLIHAHSQDFRAGHLDSIEAVAARSAAVKLRIVACDLHEAGQRRLLNFGHTLGHALEACTAGRVDALAHGDAVSLGMVFATRLSRRLGLLDDENLEGRLRELLHRVRLPVELSEVESLDRTKVIDALAQDKKRLGGRNVWVLPRRPGDLVCRTVTDEDVLSVLEEMKT